MSFRAYLIRRSQALRALRELAIAKTKLKELRALFNNFTYRRRVARDAEERQRFSEKIIVLLLTVDAIEVYIFRVIFPVVGLLIKRLYIGSCCWSFESISLLGFSYLSRLYQLA